MSDRPTPETDDAQWGTGKVTTDFARRLERERDEARDAAQRLRVENNHNWQAMEMAEQAFRERNLAINFLLDIRRNEGRVILSQLDEVLAKLDAL